jgi:hypothetical protein
LLFVKLADFTKANARENESPSVHPLRRGNRQASRDSGSQSKATTTTKGQPKQQMEPTNRELHSLIRNSQVALLLAKNVDPDEISLKTNEPGNIRGMGPNTEFKFSEDLLETTHNASQTA